MDRIGGHFEVLNNAGKHGPPASPSCSAMARAGSARLRSSAASRRPHEFGWNDALDGFTTDRMHGGMRLSSKNCLSHARIALRRSTIQSFPLDLRTHARHANGWASKLAHEASMRTPSTPRYFMRCLRTLSPMAPPMIRGFSRCVGRARRPVRQCRIFARARPKTNYWAQVDSLGCALLAAPL